MLLIAAHVLGDVRRWWNETGRHIEGELTLGEVFLFLHNVAIEAEAAWSILPAGPNGSRVCAVSGSQVEMFLRLQQRGGDIVVVDVRIKP